MGLPGISRADVQIKMPLEGSGYRIQVDDPVRYRLQHLIPEPVSGIEPFHKVRTSGILFQQALGFVIGDLRHPVTDDAVQIQVAGGKEALDPVFRILQDLF